MQSLVFGIWVLSDVRKLDTAIPNNHQIKTAEDAGQLFVSVR